MTNLLRIDPTKMDFGWNPDQRVPKITEALNEQRANLRAATDRHNIDVATRNVADLEKTLERAQTNEAARQKHIQEIEAAETAKRQEHDDRALAVITDQLRTNYLAQPGTTVKEFEQVLPELLAEHRKQAVLNAPALREQQLAEQRLRLGRF